MVEKKESSVEVCGNCQHWNTNGFGSRKVVYGNEKVAAVGSCELVARQWYPPEHDKMIALNGANYAGSASSLIKVVTRREFGCNQFEPMEEIK